MDEMTRSRCEPRRHSTKRRRASAQQFAALTARYCGRMAKPTREDEAQERKDNYAASARATVVPVMIVRTTHTTVIKLSRVPCIDELIYIGPSDTHPHAQTHWRVVSVQHIPP